METTRAADVKKEESEEEKNLGGPLANEVPDREQGGSSARGETASPISVNPSTAVMAAMSVLRDSVDVKINLNAPVGYDDLSMFSIDLKIQIRRENEAASLPKPMTMKVRFHR